MKRHGEYYKKATQHIDNESENGITTYVQQDEKTDAFVNNAATIAIKSKKLWDANNNNPQPKANNKETRLPKPKDESEDSSGNDYRPNATLNYLTVRAGDKKNNNPTKTGSLDTPQ